jgi:hypothetical protein
MKYSMNPYPNVVHRKVVSPWYETEAACIITIGCMIPILLFAVAGIFTAQNHPGYQEHIWIPTILLISSACVILSILIRLVRRYINRFRNRYLKGFSVEPPA